MTEQLTMRYLLFFSLILMLSCSACKIYKFNEAVVTPGAKTVNIHFIENKARFVNPQLAPQMTDKLRQKINNLTPLTQVQNDNADYDIKCEITGYDVTTAGISNQQSATNRLIVTVNVSVKNRLDEKKNVEAPVSRNFDFSANLSLDQAQTQLLPTIIQNMVDEIFNRVFSNW